MRRLLLLPVIALLVLIAPDVATADEPSFDWPLRGAPVVDRGFDPPTSAWGAGHRGVDLRATLGADVLAAGDGRVTYAGLLAGKGVVVVAHAGGLRTTYEPVRALVHVGELVRRGDVLGTLDVGHASCRPGSVCLHWGLLRGQTYLDPLALLRTGRIRLLPSSALAAAAASTPVATEPRPRARHGGSDAGLAAALTLTGAGALVLARPR